ncbi:hypothetical protein [Frateuria defendens]|uniref:hypothetical protein n=1 Tax=Frateuria defendens TaxID=2219559 RepID=UPI00066FF6A9|nr:hypothetical protein [Frateuria defendens]
MADWLDKVLRGVDLQSPDAFGQLFLNLMELVPWAALFWWSVLFAVVGAVLGWRRGRTLEGVLWALALGPFGWLAVLRRPRRRPPPLPR